MYMTCWAKDVEPTMNKAITYVDPMSKMTLVQRHLLMLDHPFCQRNANVRPTNDCNLGISFCILTPGKNNDGHCVCSSVLLMYCGYIL